MLLLPTVAAFLSFFPLSFFLSWLTAALVHECGHLLILHICKVPVQHFTCGPAGMTLYAPCCAMSYGQECLLYYAGPAANFLLAGAALLLRGVVPFAAEVFLCALLLGVFNLLPASPMDGGRALRCLLLRLLAPELAVKIYRAISLLTGLAVWVFGGFLFFAASHRTPASATPAASLFFFGLLLFLTATSEEENRE